MYIQNIIVENSHEKIDVSNTTKYLILSTYSLSFVIFGFLVDTPIEIMNGLYNIIKCPSILITDYIVVGGVGASFVNSGILSLISVFILFCLKVNISGISVAAIFLMSGFALFGKNILNVWLIILGVLLYSKVQKDKFSKYIYIALFATSMAPTVTEILFVLNQPLWFRIILSILIGLGIGFIIPPISMHMMRVHQGYNLYNIGFTAGIISTIFVSISKSYGYVTRSRLIWGNEHNGILGIFLTLLFTSFIVTGFYLNGKSFRGVGKIFKYSGRLVSDFILMEGFGPSLINMGLNGFLGMAYVLAVGGALNGPTIGGILSIAGFGAFGKHPRNIIPIFVGVFIGSITKIWSIDDPRILLAALFGTALAPISGQFGWKYGVIAGFINSSVVLSVGVLHGGVNLYNTGFSSGIVAMALIPLIQAFRKDVVE